MVTAKVGICKEEMESAKNRTSGGCLSDSSPIRVFGMLMDT